MGNIQPTNTAPRNKKNPYIKKYMNYRTLIPSDYTQKIVILLLLPCKPQPGGKKHFAGMLKTRTGHAPGFGRKWVAFVL